MLNRDEEALRLFRRVLQLDPNHGEAKSEARLLEQRLSKRSGLLDILKR